MRSNQKYVKKNECANQRADVNDELRCKCFVQMKVEVDVSRDQDVPSTLFCWAGNFRAVLIRKVERAHNRQRIIVNGRQRRLVGNVQVMVRSARRWL